MRLDLIRVVLAALVLAAPGGASAQEPFTLHFEADAAIPVLAPTADLFQPGATGSVGFHGWLGDGFSIGGRYRGGFLSDGPPPVLEGRADPGVGDLHQIHMSLRMRPLAPAMGGSLGAGLSFEIGGGLTLTGDRARPSAEASLGWGFDAGDVAIGPVVRWTMVYETDDQLEPRPANVLLIGLELTIFDSRQPIEAPTAVGDRDLDGIPDDVDACTDEPEDFDSYQDEDGCPDPDNDADGVLDVDDLCPVRAEDHDGFADDDGCPDPDDDGDGILDVDDACPREPEVINGVRDRDGCPDEGLIVMQDDRIVLDERVLFDFSRARLRPAARPVLAAIATLQAQHPEWVRVRIEGHADIRGTVDGNQRLSEMRADRVRGALVELGVPTEMVQIEGFGASRPRYQGRTEEIHQANRRVEFVVVARRSLTDEEQAAEDAEAERERREAREERADDATREVEDREASSDAPAPRGDEDATGPVASVEMGER